MAMTLARLRAIAKSEGVKGYSKMGKRELEIAIYQARCDSLDGTKEQSQATNKTTVEQAVAAVQSATTAEEIQAVLEQCKKDQLHEVFLAVTGIKDSPCPKSWKKADIVLHCKWGIVAYKARNAFKAMDAETRAEYLTSEQFELDNNSVDTLMAQLTPYELITLNAALGVTFEEYKDICEGYRAISSLKSSIRRAVRRAHMTEHERAIEDDARRVARAAYEDVTAKNATPVEKTQEQPAVSEISSYDIGKQIIALKGKAKAQQALLKSCGDDFLLDMMNVFSHPVSVTMEDPDELRKYMCRGVIQVARDAKYAALLLKLTRVWIAKARAKTMFVVDIAHLEGWAKFLEECAHSMRRFEDINQTESVAVISPDYDSAFDEPAYSPDVQDITVNVDDIPADHEPDIQEIGIAVYEAMETAYTEYICAEDKYLTSKKTDMAEKAKSDAAFRKYLTLLYEYRRCGMPKREEALNWVREFCSKSYWPEDDLPRKSIDVLETLCHKCGIHAADFKVYCNKHDMAVRLLREAGIETREPTEYEQDVELRKELQSELHKYWQKRHALRKAQRIFGAGSADAEALNGMWEQYQEEADLMLYKYKAVAMRLKKWREYEVDSRGISPAPVQEVKPIVELKAPEPEVQVVLASKSKVSHVYRKKSRTPIRKSHAPSWIQSRQLTSKTSKHSPNRKPLVKLSKSASTLRAKKF